MGTSNKYTPKILTTFCTVVFSLSATANSANAIPTAEDINSLAETARLTADTFMQASFKLRLGHEYSGKFLHKDDKEQLHKLSKTASDRLQAIAKNQKQLKQQIEDYEGDDWDARYGSTGLWRKLFTDLYITNLGKCEVDFYFALTTEQPERNEILRKILSEIDSLSRTYKQFGPILIKGRVLALLSQTETVYSSAAIKELEAFKVYSDVSRPIRAAIEKIKLVGSAKPDELNALVRCLEQNRHPGDLELVLPLAFLQRQYDPAGFEKTIGLFPETQDFLGTLILSDISGRIVQQKDLEQISVFEAELAVQTAWKNTASNHKTLLDRLSSAEKFQTPLIMYVAAAVFTDASPAKAANLLIKASKLQQVQKSNKLDTPAEKIAKQATELAYNLFVADSVNCYLALKAFENYHTIAKGKIDEEPEYLYSIVLNNCGLREKGKKVLQKIAARPAGKWRNRARLDLIVQAIQQSKHKNQSQRSKLLRQLSDLVADCRRQNENNYQLRREAITIYCQLLLESKDKESAQKVLNILAEAETASDPNLNIFKSEALRQLGRLDESAKCLLGAIDADRCEYVAKAMELLSEVIEKIDELQARADNFAGAAQHYERLAKYCCVCLNDAKDRQVGLILAEIAVFAANKEKEKLSAVEKLLSNLAADGGDSEVGLLRCRARLLTEQGKFNEAAKLWTRICRIRKSESPSANRRSWKWWRAKFYELHCWAKCPRTSKKSVLHTIEVLENSFSNIPPLWAEKLGSLKQRCRLGRGWKQTPGQTKTQNDN